MRSVLALMRAAWLSALSYRLATLISLVGLLASVVPIYFISHAVQDLASSSIQLEGGNYFGFIITGIASVYVLSAAVSAIPGALAGSIGSGTFEALLVTRTPLPILLVGMSAYPLAQSLFRALLLLVGASVIGVDVAWGMLPLVVVIVALLIVAYGALGLVAASLVLVFRTSGPLITAIVAGSGLLGGVYYSTTVIPGWLQALSGLVPLTYGLRAGRRLLLGGASLSAVGTDVGILALIAVGGLAVGGTIFAIALRHARRAGTLSQY
jgi:ABC-2 type transport system permease protein